VPGTVTMEAKNLTIRRPRSVHGLPYIPLKRGRERRKIVPSPAVSPTEEKFEYNNESDGTAPCYGLVWLSQTFTPQVSHNLLKIVLMGFEEGNPESDFIVSIRETDLDGKPTGDDLVVKSVLASSLPSYEAEFEMKFDTQILLVAGTKYAIVCRCPDGNVEQRVTLITSSLNPYSRGENLYSEDGGGTWDLYGDYDYYGDYDFWFEEWGYRT